MALSTEAYTANWGKNLLLLMEQLEQRPTTQLTGCNKELIYAENKLRLFRYQALNIEQSKTPILITYALINRPDIVDLEPKRSLVLRLLEQGFPVYLIDWGYPDSSDCFTSLNDYINGLLHRCVQQTKRHTNSQQLDLLGICQGGVFSLCYAALHPSQVRKLITIVSPIDFHNSPLGLSIKNTVGSLNRANSNIAGKQISRLFNSLKPFQLNRDKYRQPAKLVAAKEKLDTFLHMEQWLNDQPDLAGLAANEFLRYFYQQNSLHNNKLQLANKPVLLSKIQCPVLNFYATRDHIVPATSAQALSQHIDASQYSEVALAGGHIGAFTSHKAQQTLIHKLNAWLQ
ncbi:class III poly(R)-hydroxyalkanoic acid synthase subunit PhaC [Cycloclasticus sp. 46_83_sub15_T18]|nr:class III poly(R)-hydroxyalkanoic acid synthase subunit PhaC [Cycloclasticus sp. 46_83_sub15_T18]